MVDIYVQNVIVQDDEDSILQGEKEAEKMIVEAYAALLLAFLSTARLVHLCRLILSLNTF